MNSTNEAIRFGVPMLCLPQEADQPFNAYRVADELGFGIRMNTGHINVKYIKKAIEKLIIDNSYLCRLIRFSYFDEKHNGVNNSVKEIIDHINNYKKQRN